MFRFALVGALLCACVLLAFDSTHGRNYAQVVCDDEPNPVQCTVIQNWYVQAKSNRGISCCGLGDAYWTDQIDRVTKDGLYVTITDDRSCRVYTYDEEGDVVPNQEGCISRVDRDHQQLWIPNDAIDRRRQSNPTGHIIAFVSQNTTIVDPDGKQFPGIYCFFPGIGG